MASIPVTVTPVSPGAESGPGYFSKAIVNATFAYAFGGYQAAPILETSGLPISGGAGTFANVAGNELALDVTNNFQYINFGTLASPVWAVADTEQYAILAADYVLVNGTAAQAALNSTAAGAVTLPAGTYAFEAVYYITNTGTASHTFSTLFGGTAVLSNIGYGVVGNSLTAAGAGASGVSGYANAATAFVATPASTSATENAMITLAGTFVIGTGGTVIPQVQMSAAPGGVQTMKKGSFVRIWGLPANGAVGNWS